MQRFQRSDHTWRYLGRLKLKDLGNDEVVIPDKPKPQN
jgi:hypothetical protein